MMFKSIVSDVLIFGLEWRTFLFTINVSAT